MESKKLNLVSYNGNDKETYTLFYNNEVVAEILTGEDGAIEIVNKINDFMKDKNDQIIIQNDDDMLGIIINNYADNLLDTMTIWFDDYID